MEKIFTKEVKIALVAIVAVVLLFLGMNFLKGLTLFSSATSYKMSFANLKGLSKSTAIYADGYKVGTVTSIEYDYEKAGNIIVNCDIDPQLRIPKGSQAEIESDSPVPSLQGPCDRSLKSEVPCGSCLNWR